ncbi:MAG: hypothetical protein ACO3ZG_07195 [Kiritimatiellia bacterium]
MKAVLIFVLIVVSVFFLLIKIVDKSPETPEVDYTAALDLTSQAEVVWPERGGAVEQEGFARFKEFWRDLSEERVKEWLPQVYAENVWFNDTVKTITNRAELLDYMLHTASMVKSTSVEVRDIAITDAGYYVRWVMTVEPSNTRYGDKWVSIGMTHIRLNAAGEVILHQDYWDSAGGMYEHFPVLGWMIRNIKARL